jgi:hypothetical protein
MKPHLLRVVLLLSLFASLSASAGEPATNLFGDFAVRLEAAVGTRDVSAVMGLYRTNDVPAAELAGEVAKWQHRLTDDAHAQGKMLWFGKELGTLPSEEVRRWWGEYVQHLTKHHVTHVIQVWLGGSSRLTLPLVSVDGKLCIVPSENESPGGKPGGAAKGSQPVRPETNQTPGAAGSGH